MPKSAALLNSLLNSDFWWDEAACRGADPDLFVNVKLSGPARKVPEDILATAYRYCAGCPVRSRCQDEADQHQLPGLHGGVFRTLNIYTNGKGKRSYRKIDLLSPDYDFETGAPRNKGGRPRKAT